MLFEFINASKDEVIFLDTGNHSLYRYRRLKNNGSVEALLGSTYQMIKLILAPIRGIVRFPLFQLTVVIGVILLLQASDDNSMFGQLFNTLDRLVDATVQLASAIFTIKSFTKAWLVSGFMIAYVYLAGLLILSLVRLMISSAVDFAGRSNFLYLRTAIARERGIGEGRRRLTGKHVPFRRLSRIV